MKYPVVARCGLRCITSLAVYLLVQLHAVAQLDTARIIFEPGSIPEAGSDSLPLVSLETALANRSAVQQSSERTTGRARVDIGRDIDGYVAEIGDQEAEEGPYSPQLVEDLFSAGLLSQSLPDHEQALDFFNRARSVLRINEGLDTLNQVPIMTEVARSLHALGRAGDADDVQSAILLLKQETWGSRSEEVIPAMLEFGDWHMNAFLERSNMHINIDRMNVARYMSDPANYLDNFNARNTPLNNLYQSQQTFLNAIDILVSNRNFFHPRLLELEKSLLTSYFLSMHRENILYAPDFYLTRRKKTTGSRLNTNAIELMESDEYRLGLASHERSVAYITANPESSAEDLAQAMLQAADWHLLFERKVKAANEYEAVYEYFASAPELNAQATGQLYPQFPVVLPSYLPPPNSREKMNVGSEEQLDYIGYFDVSFSINKFGKAKKLRILDSAGEITSNMEIRFKEYFRNVLFRPRFSDGTSDTDTIRLRYYIGI